MFQPSRGCWWAVELWTRHQYCRGQSVTALAIMSLIYEGIAAGKYKYSVFTASLIDIVLSHLHCFPYWYRISHNRSIQNCRIHDFLKHSFSKIKYVSLWIQSGLFIYSPCTFYSNPLTKLWFLLYLFYFKFPFMDWHGEY